MHGQPGLITVRHSLGGKRELRCKREGTRYGPVAVVPLEAGNVALIHVTSGLMLTFLPDPASAAAFIEYLLLCVSDWAHRIVNGRPVISDDLSLALSRASA